METESEMRVIAGKARRLNLKTIPGIDTRPTTDRIKETLFIQKLLHASEKILHLQNWQKMVNC